MSALAGFDCRDWEPDLLLRLEHHVFETRTLWTNDHELLALIADRVGVTASGMQYTAPTERVRRPHEPEPEPTNGWAYLWKLAGR